MINAAERRQNADPLVVRRLGMLATTAGALVATIGAVVLVGWATDVSTLKSVSPNLSTMKPNTAVAFLASGTSLVLMRLGTSRAARLLMTVLAMLAATIGALALCEYAFDLNLHLGELLFEQPGVLDAQGPGRPAFSTAACFVGVAAGLLLVDARRRLRVIGSCLVTGSLGVAAIALLGYLYGVSALYRVSPFNSMALHTAIALITVAGGVLLARPDRMRLLTSSGPEGLLLRRLVPAAAALTVALGWLVVFGERCGWFGREFVLALAIAGSVATLCALAWVVARSLAQVDAQRRDAFTALMVEEARSREADRLRELNELKNEVMSLVAHDLRTPMSVIGGFATMLRDNWETLAPDQRADMLTRIDANITRVTSLIGDVLDVSNIESGNLGFEIAPFDLGAMVTRTVGETTATDQSRAWQLTVDDDLPVAHGDEQRCWRVLSNLLSNAAKFSPPGAPVEISVDLTDKGVRVKVTDHGAGIPVDDRERIFERFTRLHQHGDAHVPGSGLGLYVCKELIEGQHGEIAVDNVEGAGASFSFVLPAEARTLDLRSQAQRRGEHVTR